MADAEFEVVIARLNELERLIKNFNQLEGAQKRLDKVPKTMRNISDATKDTNRHLTNTHRGLTKVELKAKRTQERMDAFKDARGLGGLNNVLGDTAERFENAADKARILARAGGRMSVFANNVLSIGKSMKVLEGRTDGLGKVFTTFGRTMQSQLGKGRTGIQAMSGGFKAVVTGFRTGSLSITKSLAGVGTAAATALGPVVLAIGAIGTAVFVLKRIWDANIGGLQTKFTKAMGEVRTAFGRFDAAFTKTLQKLSPLFDVVFTHIFNGFKMVFGVGKAIFEGIFIAIGPVIDTLSDLGSALSSVFGEGENKGKALDTVLKVIGGTFKVVGKIIAVAFRIALAPINLAIDAIKMFGKLVEKVKAPVVSLFDGVEKSIRFVFDKIIAIVNKIPDAFLPAEIQAIKTERSPAAEAGGGTTTNNNNVRNNNQQINVMTSREIRSDTAPQFAHMLAKQLGAF